MKNNVTRILASLLALAALALGGSAIASAMNGNNSSDQTPAKASESATGGESESGPEGADDNGSETGPEGADDNAAESEQDGNEQADAGEVVGSTATAKATAAAERETGGKAADVSAETNDAPEKGDASDPAEAVSPAGAAYEVDVTKGNKELKVYLDSQFQVLEVQADQ